MKRQDRATILVIAILLAIVYARGIKYQPDESYSKVIYVEGKGKALIQPDTLLIGFSVMGTGNTTVIAQEKMQEQVKALKNLLNQYAIAPEKIKTEQLYVNEQYDWTEGGRNFLGYQANQQINIELSGEDFDITGGEIIEKLPQVGNIQISNTSFLIKDPEAGAAEAREKAFENAKTKAEQLAKLSNKKLGKVLSINEINNDFSNYAEPQFMKSQMLDRGMNEESIGMSEDLLSRGENEVYRNLSISFELK